MLRIAPLLLLFAGCAQHPVTRYQNMLDPLVGSARKPDMDKLLGKSVSCQSEQGGQVCEYRTSRGRNHPVPDVYRKESGMGPDLSPYDHFDVLHLYYDEFGNFRDWQAVDIQN